MNSAWAARAISAASDRRSASNTSAPSARKRRTMASPMPDAPPVTIAVLLASENMGSVALAGSGRFVVDGPGAADARGEVTVEEPHGHLEMAQAPGLPAARVEAALDGGADLHVLEVKRGELFGSLRAERFEIFQ